MLTAPHPSAAPIRTDRPPRLGTLTGLRFFAALAVVCCHVGAQFTDRQSLTTLASYGYVGVSFFFMLSGFVLTWSTNTGTARRFLWMRFCRVWPLQFLLTVVAFSVLASEEKVTGPLGHVAELLLLQAWSPHQGVYFGGNGVSWSLSCEMFFYAMFPLVAGPLSRLGGRGLAVVAGVTVTVLAAAPVVANGLHVSGNLTYWLFFVFPPYRFGEFLLGMALARAVSLGLRVARPGLCTLFATGGLALVLWRLTTFTVRTGGAVARPFVALLALPLFALLLTTASTSDLDGTRTGLNWWLPLRLGEWSFALYLVHKPLFLLTSTWGWWPSSGGLTGLADGAAFVTLAVTLAAALHYLTERPIERYLRRIPIGIPSTVD
ncbi:MAG TPA: acyltransferase [Pseudonocardiaceae bacterium]|nr:acyltransferase [Pseudonocardiaceae bacterium]